MKKVEICERFYIQYKVNVKSISNKPDRNNLTTVIKVIVQTTTVI